MKYFIDAHDKTKGSFPKEEQFFDQFDALEKAGEQFHVVGHAAHVNLKDGKAFCFMSGPGAEAIRKTHAAINLPFDSITEVKRVSGADMRSPQSVREQKRKANTNHSRSQSRQS